MQFYEGLWRKRHLIPCWVLQILSTLIFAVVASLLLAAATYVQQNENSRPSDVEYDYSGMTADELLDYAHITGGVVLALSLGTLVLNIVEIVVYARHRLSPVLLLAFACVKTLVWGIWLVLCIYSAAVGSVSVLEILLSAVVAITSFAQLVLGAVYTHRKRKGLLVNRNSYKMEGLERGYDSGYGGGGR
ncbi:hypothetical protein F4819DRAFT_380395 [Hypoxylon fuscum]|nr:hypothetical protein F4819DRAFT_380395 [Hypoxylon fuscum]